MKFFKQDTVESLVKDCSNDYNEFLRIFTLAHYKSHYHFKMQLKEDFKIIRDYISMEKDEGKTLLLLQHFKEQLKFINDNPFSVDEKKMNLFLDNHYPYKEKLDKITQKSLKPKI